MLLGNPHPKPGDVWLMPGHDGGAHRGGQVVARVDRLTDYGFFADVTLSNGKTTAMDTRLAKVSPNFRRLRGAL